MKIREKLNWNKKREEILINFLSKRKGDTDKIIGNTNKIKKLKKINSNKFNLSDSVSSALNWERKIKITNKINLWKYLEMK